VVRDETVLTDSRTESTPCRWYGYNKQGSHSFGKLRKMGKTVKNYQIWKNQGLGKEVHNIRGKSRNLKRCKDQGILFWNRVILPNARYNMLYFNSCLQAFNYQHIHTCS
jgi:hypothetical protein